MIDTKTIEAKTIQENVFLKTLERDEARGLQFSIMTFGPNIQRPMHLHPDIEWVYVIKGEFTDENGTYKEGHFLANKKGSKHSLKSGPKGCEIILIWSGSVQNVNN